VPLSTQEYKWVPANCWGNLTNCGGNDLRWTSIPCRGGRNTPSHSMLQKPGISSGSYDPVGSKASFFFFDKRIHFFFQARLVYLCVPQYTSQKNWESCEANWQNGKNYFWCWNPLNRWIEDLSERFIKKNEKWKMNFSVNYVTLYTVPSLVNKTVQKNARSILMRKN